MEYLTFFIFAFTSIFVIVNPVSGILTFISLTEGMSPDERNGVALRSVTVACIMAIVFAVAGEGIMRFFSITVDSLRVAGGVLLFLIAIDMLHGRVSRESVTPEEVRDASNRDYVAVFPMAIPLLTGPGAITTVIILIRTGRTLEMKLITLLAIVLTFFLSYLFFRFANTINRIIGVTVSLVITRIMGLLLGAIAVNFVTEGLWNIYKSFN
ncbi:MAG: MarC family protein [Nitrospirae bacterium]|nr:MarC family protein [Nitrospirota bacterium]